MFELNQIWFVYLNEFNLTLDSNLSHSTSTQIQAQAGGC